MADKNKFANSIASILPDRGLDMNNDVSNSREGLIEKQAQNLANKATAKELALLKLREKKQQEREQARAHIPPGRTARQHERLQAADAIAEQLEEIDAEEVSSIPKAVLSSKGLTRYAAKQLLDLQGTTRADVSKLLASLNININLQLTKKDTSNLLACLLTCNETQLKALLNNKKIPIAIKVVIKRLLEDAKLGNMDTVERLWDRVFGKNGMSSPTEAITADTGLIPSTPISREAYIVIRDTLMK